MTHAPWLIASLAVFGVSLIATLIALRGRRVDDHPHCRRCGFDLFGKPAESSVCSECGADLAKRKAVRVGRRERRPWLLAMAVPALLLSVGWTGWDGWGRVRSVDWNPRKPTWWLVRDANGRDPAAQDAALIELARRIGAGRLPRDREDALVARALEVQADPSRPWVQGWGTLVEAAHDTGGLSEAQWLRYMTQAIAPALLPAASPAHRDKRIEFWLRNTNPRVAKTKVTSGQAIDTLHVGIYAEPKLLVDGVALDIEAGSVAAADLRRSGTGGAQFAAASYDNQPAPPECSEGIGVLQTISWAGPLRRGSYPVAATIHTAAPTPDTVKDGRHTARLRLHLVPLRSAGGGPSKIHFERAGPAVVAEVEATWNLAPGVRVNPDPSFRAAVERSLYVERIVYRADRNLPRFAGFLVCREAPPVALAYRVVIISGGRETPAGTACFFPGGFTRGAPLSAPVPPWDSRPPATVDIELRPDPDVAAPEAPTIWGGDVTLNNVPVVVVDPNATLPKAATKGGR